MANSPHDDRRIELLQEGLRDVLLWRYQVDKALDELDRWCKKYGPLVDDMAQEEKIAAAVASRLRGRAEARYTWRELFLASVLAFCALAGLAFQIIHAAVS